MSDTWKSDTPSDPEPVWEVGRWYVDYSDIAVSRNWYTRHLFMILGGPDANGWVRLLAYQEAGDDPELTLQLVGKLLGWYQALPIKNIDESGNAILDG